MSLSLYSSDVADIGCDGLKGRDKRRVGRSVGWPGDIYVEYRYFSRPKVR